MPKCLIEIENANGRTSILERQLRQLYKIGIKTVIITTGPFPKIIENHCNKMKDIPSLIFVNNPIYNSTNYIYSMYLAADITADDDILLLHGDLVFEDTVIDMVMEYPGSCMVVSSTADLPEKDFKAAVSDDLLRIKQIGIDVFDNAVAAQPLYKILKKDWCLWLNSIADFCKSGNTNVYAENALNEILSDISLRPLDIQILICGEIDNTEDLAAMNKRLLTADERLVYICFSTDILHGGHLNIIDRGKKLGRVIAGALSDEVVASYKRYPLLSCAERMNILSHIDGITRVEEQQTLSFAEKIHSLRPSFVVHGDDWRTGFQKPIREEVVRVLSEQGGSLIEFPYSVNEAYIALENQARAHLSIPDVRRGRLRRLLSMKKTATAIEAHSGITGLIAENTAILQNGITRQFDAMWVSSLCDSTAKGKPDIELIDISSRLRTIDDIMEVTTKPIILDGDTGGLPEHFIYTVRTLERMGVSAIIIEDKTGLKKNSLFGTDVEQTQDDIESFCIKIKAGKNAQKTRDFMIIARIESLILDKGMDDALERAFAFTKAGADGIMIHSRRREADEIFEFAKHFRERDKTTPLVVVPTSFNTVTEDEFYAADINIVIYANQLTRSGFPAMQKAARLILENHRAKEADDICMSIKEILTLIPEVDS